MIDSATIMSKASVDIKINSYRAVVDESDSHEFLVAAMVIMISLISYCKTVEFKNIW